MGLHRFARRHPNDGVGSEFDAVFWQVRGNAEQEAADRQGAGAAG
jgi:hypothetical protein